VALLLVQGLAPIDELTRKLRHASRCFRNRVRPGSEANMELAVHLLLLLKGIFWFDNVAAAVEDREDENVRCLRQLLQPQLDVRVFYWVPVDDLRPSCIILLVDATMRSDVHESQHRARLGLELDISHEIGPSLH